MSKVIARENIIDLIRTFFKKEEFTEVETPLLVASPDPAPYNEVFETRIFKNTSAYLAPSPEFFLKKIIAREKINKVFQICKSFRNPEEIDPLHNPEFTILEWYRTKAIYTDLMRDCENLVTFIFKNLGRQVKSDNLKLKNFLRYQNQIVDIAPPWPRTSVKEAFKKYANIDLDEFLDLEKAKEIARKKGYLVEKETSWEQLYHQIFLNEIEPKFSKDKPLILFDYPAQLAALAKLKEKDKRYAERFEFYIGGLELGNGYSELTDPAEQEKRLKADLEERKKTGKKVFDYDRDFVKSLKTMPETAGIAVGVDRLIMLFTDAKTIQEVITFPAGKIF